MMHWQLLNTGLTGGIEVAHVLRRIPGCGCILKLIEGSSTFFQSLFRDTEAAQVFLECVHAEWLAVVDQMAGGY